MLGGKNCIRHAGQVLKGSKESKGSKGLTSRTRMDTKPKLSGKEKSYAIVVKPIARLAMVAMAIAFVFMVLNSIGCGMVEAGLCIALLCTAITSFTLYRQAHEWNFEKIDRVLLTLMYVLAAAITLFYCGMRILHGYHKIVALVSGFVALVFFATIAAPLLFVAMKKSAKHKRLSEQVVAVPAAQDLIQEPGISEGHD